MKLQLTVAAILAAGTCSTMAKAQVVFSQLYGGGGNSGSVYRQDFVELYNTSTNPVNLTGWSIHYAGAGTAVPTAGTTPWAQIGGGTPQTATWHNLTGTIPAKGYYLVRMSQGTTGGSILDVQGDDNSGVIQMGSAGFQIALVNGTNPSLATAPTNGTLSAITGSDFINTATGTNPAVYRPKMVADGGRIVDFVSAASTVTWLNRNNPNTTATAPAPSNTTSIVRKGAGCTNNGDNGQDWIAVATATNPATNIFPRSSSSPTNNCVFADLGLSLTSTSPSTCNVPLASNVSYTFQVTNIGPTNTATNAQVVFTPRGLISLTNATPSAGTLSAPNGFGQSFTWNVGSLAVGQSATLTYTGNMYTQGSFTLSGTARNAPGSGLVDDQPANDSASAIFNVVADGVTRSSIASSIIGTPASSPDNAVIPGISLPGIRFQGFNTAFGRPFASPNGQYWAMAVESELTIGGTNPVSGILLGKGDKYVMVVEKGSTIFSNAGGTPSTVKALGSVNASFYNPFDQNIVVSDNGDILFTCRDDTDQLATTTTDESKKCLVKGTLVSADFTQNPPVVSYNFTVVAREGQAVPAAVATALGTSVAATWASDLSAAGLQSNGASFYGRVTGGSPAVIAGKNEVLVTSDGTSVLVTEGVSFPTGQLNLPASNLTYSSAGTGATTAGFDLSTDTNYAQRGFARTANGLHWKVETGTGRTGSTPANDVLKDQMLVVDGGVVIQEGFPVGNPAIFPGETVEVPLSNQGGATALTQFSTILEDGTWYAQGWNLANGVTGLRRGWIVRGNGSNTASITKIAATGENITPTSTEKWSNAALGKTFTGFAARGSNYVITGLTDRGDSATDSVIVHNGQRVLAREGDRVNIGTTASPIYAYMGPFIMDNRLFIDNNNVLYVVAQLKTADYNCTTSGGQVGQAILKFPLVVSCNRADVATIGSGVSGGPDGVNTVDDIIGYLDAFFNSNLAVADLVTLGGGPLPDGQITVDDLIYFLSQFFAPCNN
jgi:hypothetical protein